MKLCSYGCGQEAKYQFKNGKWCCSKSWNSCPIKKLSSSKSMKDKICSEERKKKISNSQKGRKWIEIYGEKKTRMLKNQMSRKRKGKTYEELYGKVKAKKLKKERRISIKKIEKRYPFFSKVEEMRYNPDKPNEKEIQVHCKNHNCINSKEKGGWFTPTLIQIQERIRQIEHVDGNDGCYFYCSDECKNQCPLFNTHSDPYKNKEVYYTSVEYQTFRKFVLERDNYICQFCGGKATDVHHERPQKLEPFFSLDPDFAWSCCKECHYKYGHKDECSTGKLASKICLRN